MVAGVLGAQAPFPARDDGRVSLGAKVLHRSMRMVRMPRCERLVSPYTRGSYRPMREVRIVLYEWLVPLGTRPQSSKGLGVSGACPEQRCGKEGDRKGRGKPLALIKGFSSPLHNTLSSLQFIAKSKEEMGS